MTNETVSTNQDRPRTKIITRTNASVPVYGLGFVGAVVYFVQHAATFWLGVLGVLKAVVWPALVVYRVLELLKF
jgi:hypothetical protein